ncbi:hypothetical protein BCR43DRAFT_486659 [Syncephalastrum racemosum]|uniref:Uncharacterized protein n=1 Tax=Syncephalastrum racemosum TaxID=13706 RepID=A0A1X2HPF5_SYNRA|nr:hypothetical protein BCR43DRAFT_486659 [Syncephalastrum racemosum]
MVFIYHSLLLSIVLNKIDGLVSSSLFSHFVVILYTRFSCLLPYRLASSLSAAPFNISFPLVSNKPLPTYKGGSLQPKLEKTC